LMAAISITTLVYGASRDLGIPKMRHLDSEIYRHFLSITLTMKRTRTSWSLSIPVLFK